MRILSHKLKYGKAGDVYRIYFIGDIHFGSIFCDKDKLKEDIEEAVKYGPQQAGVILMGDYGEFIGPEDRRFDPLTVDPEVINMSNPHYESQTAEYAAEFLRPLVENNLLLGMLGGNHGMQNRRTGRMDRWDFVVAEKLGADHLYLGYSGFVRLQFEANRGGAHRTIVSHVHHGWQGGKTKGTKVNQLEKELGWVPEADFLVRGHSHNLITTPFYSLGINQRGTDIITRKHIVGHSGSYLHTMKVDVESYAERAGFRPEGIGCLKTWIRFTREGYEIFGGV